MVAISSLDAEAALQANRADRLLIDGQLRLLEQMKAEVEGIENALAEISYPNPNVRLLMTMPGIGPAVAQTVVAALGDWKRFGSGDQAASYLGLVPSTRQSAGHGYHGSITKAGASHARWLLTQAAQQLAVHPGPWGGFFRRIQRRKGHNIAVVATARKMVTVAWLMVQHNEPYRYSLPGPTQTKLASFRVAAKGQRRRKGPLVERLQPRPNGVRVRTIFPLDRVYQMEGLPKAKTLEGLAPGERRLLRVTPTEKLVRRITKWNDSLTKPVHANRPRNPTVPGKLQERPKRKKVSSSESSTTKIKGSGAIRILPRL